jgi:hypothetical protein
MIDRHTLAIISLVGSSLNVIGTLYLAYDLLGGEHGPLRTLTRAVTYGLIIGAGFGIALGPLAGLIIGVTHGITLGWELAEVARQNPKPGFWIEVLMSAIRGFGYGLATALLFGTVFGITFGAFSTIGQVIGYGVGVRPSLDYAPSTRPRMTRGHFLAVLNRTVGYAIAGFASALIGRLGVKALPFGLKVGLWVGAITAIVIFLMPFIVWRVVHMLGRRMGVFVVILILLGFALQSVQYWATLLGWGISG